MTPYPPSYHSKADIIASINNRNNLYARPSDDPLFGIVITAEMLSWAQRPDQDDKVTHDQPD